MRRRCDRAGQNLSQSPCILQAKVHDDLSTILARPGGRISDDLRRLRPALGPPNRCESASSVATRRTCRPLPAPSISPTLTPSLPACGSWPRFPAAAKTFQTASVACRSTSRSCGKRGVEIVDSIPALLERVDAVLLESLDGRKHLEQARPVIAAGKPLFIDKPVRRHSGRRDRDFSPGGREERSLLFQLLAAVQPWNCRHGQQRQRSATSWAAMPFLRVRSNPIIPICFGTASTAWKFCTR